MSRNAEFDLGGIEIRLTGRLIADAHGIAVFPDGQIASDPLSWASQLRQELGDRIKIYGFWCFENPQATVLNELRERHDFAVLDDRWIVDLWMGRYYPEYHQGIIDIEDAAEYERARVLYGCPECWERDLDMEIRADHRITVETTSPSIISTVEHVSELQA